MGAFFDQPRFKELACHDPLEMRKVAVFGAGARQSHRKKQKHFRLGHTDGEPCNQHCLATYLRQKLGMQLRGRRRQNPSIGVQRQGHAVPVGHEPTRFFNHHQNR